MTSTDTYADVSEDGSIDGFEASFIDVNGVRTRYYELGEDHDETLLLVHGGSWGGSSSANTWTPVLRGLAESFHVLAPDRLACGMTDNPGGESAYAWAFESELEHVRDFLDVMGVDRFHVCGNSRGMAATSWLAVEYPDRVRTVVCVNSNTIGPPIGDYGHRRTVLAQGEPTGPSATIEEVLRHRAAVWTYDPERTLTEEYLRAQAYMATREKALETAAVMADGGTERIEQTEKFEVMDDIRAGLPKGALGQPILLFWGRHDLTAVLEMGLALYELLSQGNPNVRLHLVDRAGHLPYRDYPEEFVRTATTFIDHWKDNRRSMEEVRPRRYAEYYRSDRHD